MVPVPKAVLLGMPLFRLASDEATSRLAAAATESQHIEDDILWRVGDVTRSLTIIRRGLVQIVKPAHVGPAATLGLFGPRECPGLVAVLGPGRYPAEAIAISHCVDLVHLPPDLVRALLQREPAVAEAANQSLVAASQMLLAKIDVLTAGEVPQRLATLFLHLTERFGDNFAHGEVRIPVALSRGVLARLVGVRSETVIRVMTRWERDGLLHTESDGFTIADRHWLARMASGDAD